MTDNDFDYKMTSPPPILMNVNDNEAIAKFSHQIFLDGSILNDKFVTGSMYFVVFEFLYFQMWLLGVIAH